MKQSSLSVSEQTELSKLETVIKRGIRSFIEVGKALMDVRDKRLYRGAFATFEEYCQRKWGIGDRRAKQLITGSRVAGEMAGTQVPMMPENEKQVRPLAGLTPPQREQVWGQAVEEAGGQPPASRVAELARKALAGLPPERQREVLAGEEARIQQSRQDFDLKLQGDSRARRLEQIRYLSGRLRRLTEGLGGEADSALEDLDGFDRAIGYLSDS